MQIENLYLHNFSNIPDGEYGYGEITLITGGNGSGKTSMADAIQTVMTAARDGWYRYNPGQEEGSHQTKKKSKRTIESYVLGCDETPYSRPYTCDGYIGINWIPSPGETGEPFSSMIAARATLVKEGDKRIERLLDLAMYIIPGRNVSLDDLKTDDGSAWLDMEKGLRPALYRKFGGKNGVEMYDAKEKYLTRLYGAFQGSKGSLTRGDAKQMVKAWTKFMAYHQVDDLGKFVRESVLEAKDNSELIEQVRSLMREIARMTADAQHIDEGITIISTGIQKTAAYFRAHIDHYRKNAVLTRANHIQYQSEYNAKKDLQQTYMQEIASLGNTAKTLEAEKETLFNELAAIEGLLKGHANYNKTAELQEQVEAAEERLTTAGVALTIGQSKAVNAKDSLLTLLNLLDNRDGSRWTGQVAPLRDDLAKALKAMESLQNVASIASDGDVSIETLRSPQESASLADIALGAVCDQLGEIDDERSLRGRLTESLYSIRREVQSAQREIEKLTTDIDLLENNARVSHPAEVTRTLDALLKTYPDCNPRVVGDHIDIKDPEWQQAIEGFLGGARHYIIVDPAFETAAIELVRDKRFNSKVIQGEKARIDAKKAPPPDGSIVTLMEFTDEGVRSYMSASYGRVLQAENAEALRSLGRGLTKDGMGSSSYAMRYCLISERDLMCGKGAIMRRIQALEVDLGNAKTSYSSISDQSHEVRQLTENLNKLERLRIADALATAIAAVEQKDKVLREIALIDLSDVEELQDRQSDVNAQYKDTEQALKETEAGITSRNTNLFGIGGTKSSPQGGSLTHTIQQLSLKKETSEDKAEEALDSYIRYLEDHQEAEAEDVYQAIQSEAEAADEDKRKSLHIDLEKRQSAETALRQIEDQIYNFNLNPIQGEPIQNTIRVLDETQARIYSDTLYGAVMDARNQLQLKLQNLKNNVLVVHRETLEDTQVRFEETFTQQIVQVILDQSKQATKTLNTINRELKSHKFDDETFEFSYVVNKEFQPYLKCFKELEGMGATARNLEGSLLFGGALSEESTRILNDIKDLLLQDDAAKASVQLSRIADYRNYYEYDILKKPEGKDVIHLSKYGRGSGGQNETPFYVIMCAAFQSSLRFHSGTSHLRTICIDESFTRLDENRTRRIISYLCEKVGLQIIFVSPPSKAGVYKDLLTNEVVMERVHDDNPPPRSELQTRVIVDQQVTNPERIAELFDSHKESVSQQAQLSFMEMLAAENKEGAA
jgi:energy-coupling factor transporter ATP-binding protein EcfA2